MAFDTFAEFLAMGKHGLYVWTSYGVFALVMGINMVAVVVQHRQARRSLQQMLRRERLQQQSDGPES